MSGRGSENGFKVSLFVCFILLIGCVSSEYLQQHVQTFGGSGVKSPIELPSVYEQQQRGRIDHHQASNHNLGQFYQDRSNEQEYLDAGQSAVNFDHRQSATNYQSRTNYGKQQQYHQGQDQNINLLETQHREPLNQNFQPIPGNRQNIGYGQSSTNYDLAGSRQSAPSYGFSGTSQQQGYDLQSGQGYGQQFNRTQQTYPNVGEVGISQQRGYGQTSGQSFDQTHHQSFGAGAAQQQPGYGQSYDQSHGLSTSSGGRPPSYGFTGSSQQHGYGQQNGQQNGQQFNRTQQISPSYGVTGTSQQHGYGQSYDQNHQLSTSSGGIQQHGYGQQYNRTQQVSPAYGFTGTSQQQGFGQQSGYGRQDYNRSLQHHHSTSYGPQLSATTNYEQSTDKNVQCDPDYSGPQEHPYDCAKFINCANGVGYIQPCGPGTVFNPHIKQCDWPYNVDCGTKKPLYQAHSENPASSTYPEHHETGRYSTRNLLSHSLFEQQSDDQSNIGHRMKRHKHKHKHGHGHHSHERYDDSHEHRNHYRPNYREVGHFYENSGHFYGRTPYSFNQPLGQQYSPPQNVWPPHQPSSPIPIPQPGTGCSGQTPCNGNHNDKVFIINNYPSPANSAPIVHNRRETIIFTPEDVTQSPLNNKNYNNNVNTNNNNNNNNNCRPGLNCPLN